MMTLYIRHMITKSCQAVVQEHIRKLGLNCCQMSMGVVKIDENLTLTQYAELNTSLQEFGLELMEDQNQILVEKIKNIVIEVVNNDHESPKLKFSRYLSQRLGYNYTYLSNLFSSLESGTINDFLIRERINRAKQLLAFHEYNLTQISCILHYSSVAHLSNQFKKITGLTPSHYKIKHRKQPLYGFMYKENRRSMAAI